MLPTRTARPFARTIHCALLAGLGVVGLPGEDARATEPALPNQPVTIKALADLAAGETPAVIDPPDAPAVAATVAAPPTEAVAGDEARPLGVPAPERRAAEQDEAADGGSILDAFDPREAELPRVVGALAVVVGLILLLRVVLRRASGTLGGSARPSGVLEILARYPVARGQSLVLLKMGRRVLLLHQTATGMTTLTEVAGADEVAALLGRLEAGAGGRDAGRFRAALRAYESEHARTPARTGPREEPARLGPDSQIEVVDLTRSRGRRLLGRRAPVGGRAHA